MSIELELTSRTVQRAIGDLENLDFIPTIDKAHLLLVANGNKPSMHTGFFSEVVAAGHSMLNSDTDNRDAFAGIITDLGLTYRIELKIYDDEIDGIASYSARIVFCVAKHMSVVDKLYEAREKGDDKTEGTLLGFPESAVTAYVNNDLLDMASHPISTMRVTADEMKLLNHRLSKGNWEEEVNYLSDYARTIKLLSPKIYNQCISE